MRTTIDLEFFALPEQYSLGSRNNSSCVTVQAMLAIGTARRKSQATCVEIGIMVVVVSVDDDKVNNFRKFRRLGVKGRNGRKGGRGGRIR